MEAKSKFYLPSLMRVKDMEIRKFAEKNNTVTAEAYMDTVSQLLELTPAALVALDNISETILTGDEQSLKFLSDYNQMLENIGCYDFSEKLNSLIVGNAALSSVNDLIVELTEFYKRVVKLQNVPKSFFEGGGAYDPFYTNMLKYKLPAIIERLDKREETRPLQILTVDDTSFVLKTVFNILGELYKVHILNKPTMVNTLLDHIVPELFLLDYKMPEMSGFDLVPVIRSREEHAETPIIFLTAISTNDNFSEAINLGACDFIVKPFKPDTLLQKVSKHIVRKKTF